MALLPESSTWEAGIYQLEETDVVQGGPNGIDNLQAKQLVNRTLYLKNQVDALGTGKQPIDALLTAIAALVTAADRVPYFTGVDTVAMTTLTAYMRTVLAAADATAARTLLGAATQADINAAIAALVASSPATLDTLNELAVALGNDANFATTMANALALKAPLASPALTGTPTAPTAEFGTNNTQIASTAFVQAAIDAVAGNGYMLVRDERASGTHGGSCSAGDTATRTLNTVMANTIPGASLASNRITLPAGTYRFRAHAPAVGCDLHRALLYNVTSGSVAAVGTNENATGSSGDDVFTKSNIDVRLVISSAASFEVQHYTFGARASSGFGAAVGTGAVEVYTVVEIIKES